eukprot:s1532_g4.t1
MDTAQFTWAGSEGPRPCSSDFPAAPKLLKPALQRQKLGLQDQLTVDFDGFVDAKSALTVHPSSSCVPPRPPSTVLRRLMFRYRAVWGSRAPHRLASPCEEFELPKHPFRSAESVIEGIPRVVMSPAVLCQLDPKVFQHWMARSYVCIELCSTDEDDIETSPPVHFELFGSAADPLRLSHDIHDFTSTA